MNYDTIFKVVKASGVNSGELVLVHFWGEDTDLDTANDFMKSVAALGASPVLLRQSRSVNCELFSLAEESCFDERYFELFSAFDAVLDVFTYRPVILGRAIAGDKTELYRKYMSGLFSTLLKSRRFTQLRIPTVANAEESGLEPEDYVLRLNEAYDVDYDELKAKCKAKLCKYENARRLKLYTGNDCVLDIETGDRTWHIDAGDGDMPCGEIYIAPIESKTNGRVHFDELYFDGECFGKVTLIIRNGEVVAASSSELDCIFADMPRENRIICEFGIGMNPKVKELCGYTVLDEKLCGSFHLAVGANDMFGGENSADDHIDMVGFGRTEVAE